MFMKLVSMKKLPNDYKNVIKIKILFIIKFRKLCIRYGDIDKYQIFWYAF